MTFVFWGIGLLLHLVVGFLAARKGYSFLLWIFTGIFLGLIVLAFLPHVNKGKYAGNVGRKRLGNIIGASLTVIQLLGGLTFLISKLMG